MEESDDEGTRTGTRCLDKVGSIPTASKGDTTTL